MRKKNNKNKPKSLLPKSETQKKNASQKKSNRSYNWLPGILALTLIVFFPALNNAFTNWDDPALITENPLIKKLNAENIKRIFTEVYFGNYQPLHILSYAIEYQFYKLNPVGYHITSLVMHLISTALVFVFVSLISQNKSIAVITALLFGIHPLHVESVAWAAERKDMLYAMFFISSLIFYVKYIKEEQKAKYFVLAFILFALSIFSKAMAASLPPILFLLDFYYKRKFTFKIILEKIPFFALAVGIGLMATYSASTTDSISLHVYSLFERILIANFNLLAYVWKLILPVNLSAFYPYPARVEGSLPFYFYIAPFVVLVLLVLIILSLKKNRNIFFGAGFFVASIVLVLQLFPVGPTIMSERYSYLPSVGFFFVIAYFIQLAVEKKPSSKVFSYSCLAVYSLFLCITTYNRCEIWKDSMTLWTNVIEQFPHVGTALNNRGNVYGKELGQLDKAMEDFNNSIKYDPTYENAYANRGIVHCLKGNLDLALLDFNKALELKPDYFDALFNRGIAYTQLKQFDNAIRDFNQLQQTNKDDSRIYNNRGRAHSMSGRHDEAMADYNKAININPAFAEAYYNRAAVFYNKQLYNDAYNDIQKAANLGFTIDPKFSEAIKKAVAK